MFAFKIDNNWLKLYQQHKKEILTGYEVSSRLINISAFRMNRLIWTLVLLHYITFHIQSTAQ